MFGAPGSANGSLTAVRVNGKRFAGFAPGSGATGCQVARFARLALARGTARSPPGAEFAQQPGVASAGWRRSPSTRKSPLLDSGHFDRLARPCFAVPVQDRVFDRAVLTGTTSAPACPPDSSSAAISGARRSPRTAAACVEQRVFAFRSGPARFPEAPPGLRTSTAWRAGAGLSGTLPTSTPLPARHLPASGLGALQPVGWSSAKPAQRLTGWC